jgi:hypothetical protein
MESITKKSGEGRTGNFGKTKYHDSHYVKGQWVCRRTEKVSGKTLLFMTEHPQEAGSAMHNHKQMLSCL